MRVALFIARHLKGILVTCGLIFLVQTVLLLCGAFKGKNPSPYSFALTTAADELMTFSSPDTIVSTNNYLASARIFGWAVCISGWLMVPILIGTVISHAHDVEQAEWALRLKLIRLGREAGFVEPQLSQYVNEMLLQIKSRLGIQ